MSSAKRPDGLRGPHLLLRVLKVFSPRVKRPKLESDHPIQVENKWKFTSFHGVHRRSCTFTLHLYLNTIIQAYIEHGYTVYRMYWRHL